MHGMNLSALDLNLLVALDALLEEKSVTRAAKRVGLSQPAMSHALSRLRDVLSDPLLVRNGQQLACTPRALELAPRLRENLESLRATLFDTNNFEPSSAERTFSISTADYASLILLPRLMSELTHEAPNVDVHILPPLVDDIAGKLARGELDLVIGIFSSEQTSLYIKHILYEKFVCMLRRDHPYAKRPLTLERYCELRHIMVAPQNTRGSFVDTELARLGKTRRVALTVPQFSIVPHVVATTDCVWTAPEKTAHQYATMLPVTLRPLPIQLAGFTLSLAWHERMHNDQGHRWFREKIIALSQELSAQQT